MSPEMVKNLNCREGDSGHELQTQRMWPLPEPLGLGLRSHLRSPPTLQPSASAHTGHAQQKPEGREPQTVKIRPGAQSRSEESAENNQN